MIPPVILALILANVAVFLLGQGGNTGLIQHFALWPMGAGVPTLSWRGVVLEPLFQPWQLISYAFLHAGLLHLLFNMYALWMFGSRLAWDWGSRRFLAYYLICVIGAALLQLVVASAAVAYGKVYPTVGASGGVFGVLLAYGLRYPNTRLMLLIPPVPIRAKWFVLLLGGLELLLGVTGSQAGVAHFAHLGGMLFGYLMLRTWMAR